MQKLDIYNTNNQFIVFQFLLSKLLYTAMREIYFIGLLIFFGVIPLNIELPLNN